MNNQDALNNLADAFELLADAIRQFADANKDVSTVEASPTFAPFPKRSKYQPVWESMLKGNAVKVSVKCKNALRQRQYQLPDTHRVATQKLDKDTYLMKIVRKYPDRD